MITATDDPKRICIIGLGEIGLATAQDMQGKLPEDWELIGVDVDPQRIKEAVKTGINAGDTLPAATADVYVITVYTTQQVFDVLQEIIKSKPKGVQCLASIESTIAPSATLGLNHYCGREDLDVVVFPHRYNPGDPSHRVFNTKRVLGSDSDEALHQALWFYKHFMSLDDIYTTKDLHTAALSKVVENATRYLEIAWAEQLCDNLSNRVDFDDLRAAVNTKWNIDLKEARDGIGGKCLGKDALLLSDACTDLGLIAEAVIADAKYKLRRKR